MAHPESDDKIRRPSEENQAADGERWRRSETGGRTTGPSRSPGKPKRRRLSMMFAVLLVGSLVSLLVIQLNREPEGPSDLIRYSELLAQARAGHVAEVTIDGQQATGRFNVVLRRAGDSLYELDEPLPAGTTLDDVHMLGTFETVIPQEGNATLLAVLEEHGVPVQAKTDELSLLDDLVGLLLRLTPLLLIVAFFVWMTRGTGGATRSALRFGQSEPQVHDSDRPQITFADLAGEDEAKSELTQVVDFLRNPARYHALGARLPRGILLIGPPGTGKTLMARAVAGEADVPFFSISASQFVELFVGVGASRVRDLFEKAKAAAPAIVFIDELDAVGRQRFAGIGGGNDEREQTLNQLLVELDGFDARQDVVILAATNRPDVLDPALLRPGRFDRRVALALPDRRGREAILRLHARSVPLAADADLPAMAAATPGFSGADLANLVNEAALTAAKRESTTVGRADFDAALDRIVLGTERPILIGKREQRILAYHEAGHAIAAAFTPNADPLRKITIIPRGLALGMTVQTPIEDHVTYGVHDLLARLTVLMGGRAAELLVVGEASTGAENDLKEATALARKMVGLWGMSDEIGPFFLGMGEEHVFLGRELAQEHDLGEATLDRAEAATQRLLRDALERAQTLVKTHREELDRLAARLLVEETLDQEEIAALIGAAHPTDIAPPPQANAA